MSQSTSVADKVSEFIRRPWCSVVAITLLIVSFISNLVFLYHHCPFDLSEDESHYWLWSQHMAWGYYSKGPGIAAIIYVATHIGRMFGAPLASMPVIRTPAVIFSLLSGVATWFLARRMFRDDRAGLMAILLSDGAPVFAVGSLIMTIDSPMYLCWAWAVVCLWMAVEPRPNGELPQGKAPAGWLYLSGVLFGLGILAKPVLLFLPPSALIAAMMNPYLRRRLATWNSLGAVLVGLAMQIPTLIWNAQHHWIMFLHIGGEGGLESRSGLLAHLEQLPAHVGLYIGSQAGILAGILFGLLVAAIWQVIVRLRRSHDEIEKVRWAFLIGLTLPIFGFYFILSLWTKIEPNWPAAGYFTGIVLLAGVATHWFNDPGKLQKAWRFWIIAAVVWGFSLTVLAENVQRLYSWAATWEHNGIPFPRWDPAARLHGMKLRADAIEKVRMSMWNGKGPKPMVISNRWDVASSLDFYIPDHPFVFCIGQICGGRQSQYDLWPGIDQKTKSGRLRYAGRDAVLTGSFSGPIFNHVIRPAFKKVSPMMHIPLYYHHVLFKTLNVWKCYGFKGFDEKAAQRF